MENIVELNMFQAAGLAVLMLVIGRMLVNKIEFLRKYCIPAPVVGGLIFAILHVILRSAGVVEFNMDTTLQTVFMTAFFCSVGYMAAFGELKKGGIGVVKFLILAILMCCIQDIIGGFGAKLFGLDGIIFSNAVTTLISTAIALLLCRSWSRKMFSGTKG